MREGIINPLKCSNSFFFTLGFNWIICSNMQRLISGSYMKVELKYEFKLIKYWIILGSVIFNLSTEIILIVFTWLFSTIFMCSYFLHPLMVFVIGPIYHKCFERSSLFIYFYNLYDNISFLFLYVLEHLYVLLLLSVGVTACSNFCDNGYKNA